MAASSCWVPACVRVSRRGKADGHHLVNRSAHDAVYLEVGDRTPGDGADYPDDDLVARAVEGGWQFTRKDGTPY